MPIHFKMIWICSVCCGIVVGVGYALSAIADSSFRALHVAMITLNGIMVAWGCMMALRRPAKSMLQTVRETIHGKSNRRIVWRTRDCFAHLADEINQLLQRHEYLASQVRSLERLLREAQEQVHSESSRREEIATKRSRELSVVSELAIKDELTGLANRREALNRLKLFWNSTQMFTDPLACILLDIDHFKTFNDKHGHAAGDLVLKKTAEVLRRSARDSDVVCRFGGEEFLILCPYGGLQGAAECAEKLRLSVDAQEVNYEGEELHVTVSLGVAVRYAAIEQADELIRIADQCLYRAKEGGRNRVVTAEIASDSTNPPKAGGSPQPDETASPEPVAVASEFKNTPAGPVLIPPVDIESIDLAPVGTPAHGAPPKVSPPKAAPPKVSPRVAPSPKPDAQDDDSLLRIKED